MAHVNTVLVSVSLSGDQICVDLFVRPDGTFGYEEFRRDPEDGGRGWYPIGFHGHKVFASAEAAKDDARKTIGWLDGTAF